MAYSFPRFTLITFFFLLSSTSFLINPSLGHFATELSEAITTKRMAKTSHLHFFFHDIHSGKNPTSVYITGPKNPDNFGTTYMMDNVLTEGKELSSKIIGRAQGMYSIASQIQNEIALLVVVNFEFVEGKYNGSSISVLGRNPVLHDVREMPIVGGSGVFRFGRGYALAHTVMFDPKTGDAIVEYNMYVQHY